MTFAEYLQAVAKYHNEQRPHVRIGQAYYNCLPTSFIIEHIGSVAGADIDPFHDDSKLPDFLAYVEVNWPT